MRLIKVILWKLPGTRCSTRGEGDEAVISHWNEHNPDPQPTPEQLAQWKQEYIDQGIEELESAKAFVEQTDIQTLLKLMSKKFDVPLEELTEELKQEHEDK